MSGTICSRHGVIVYTRCQVFAESNGQTFGESRGRSVALSSIRSLCLPWPYQQHVVLSPVQWCERIVLPLQQRHNTATRQESRLRKPPRHPGLFRPVHARIDGQYVRQFNQQTWCHTSRHEERGPQLTSCKAFGFVAPITANGVFGVGWFHGSLRDKLTLPGNP